MRTIRTQTPHVRMGTQELLAKIQEAVREGTTELRIEAQGQHDIGGPLWNAEGKEIVIDVVNPGQRVGAMALPKTTVRVHGSAPADVGWLNSGGTIVVLGDCGDTAGHCAASGVLYIAGRAGTRSGSLMKHDPLSPPPELWILKDTGSFSFEFLSGGYAIVCGCDCEDLSSVLGIRPCVGMVGGTVYVRGKIPDIPEDVVSHPLSSQDIAFLGEGLPRFLSAISEEKKLTSLTLWEEWQKIVPATKHEQHRLTLAEYRKTSWITNGLFAEIFPDAGGHTEILGTGAFRLRIPQWAQEDCKDCKQCAISCPRKAIRRHEQEDGISYVADSSLCIGCGLCSVVCPEHAWTLHDNPFSQDGTAP